jgi:histidinol dehydrogenase
MQSRRKPKELRIERLKHVYKDAWELAQVVRSLAPQAPSVERRVKRILTSVHIQGDEAVLEHTRRFDAKDNANPQLLVEQDRLDAALKRLPLDVVAGLQVAIANVAQVAQAGVEEDRTVELPQGQRVVLRELPVRSAAVYVPGGNAPYLSTVVMGVVTARAAGVLDVVVCSPPGPDGEVHEAILGACRLCGVSHVYRMGGAQAIGALAYGTRAVDRVDVIVGPGNLYVQEAKRQVSSVVGIDGFAGPSDLLVIFGEDADPRLVALDMLAQAEHGEGSLVVATSPHHPSLDALARELRELAETRPTVGAATCVLVYTDPFIEDALDLANTFAPEHLELVGVEAEALAPKVRSAGCLFVGASAATAFGDYVVGSNHVLPTAGAARFASALSPRHFRRRMAEVRIGAAAGKLAQAGVPIARMEGFEVHAESMLLRARLQAEAEPRAPGVSSDSPLGENEVA